MKIGFNNDVSIICKNFCLSVQQLFLGNIKIYIRYLTNNSWNLYVFIERIDVTEPSLIKKKHYTLGFASEIYKL